MSVTHLIEKRLAFVVDCVADIRKQARVDRLSDDVVQRRFVEHTLQIGIQALVDVAFAISSDQNLGEPSEQRAAFDRLASAGWISPALRDTCRRMVAFRNVVVHRYLQVDPAIVRRIVERDLEDLLEFVRTIRDRLRN